MVVKKLQLMLMIGLMVSACCQAMDVQVEKKDEKEAASELCSVTIETKSVHDFCCCLVDLVKSPQVLRVHNQNLELQIADELKRQNVMWVCDKSLALDNACGASPLHYVVRYGYVVLVQALILAGANVNQQDKNKATPLHWAAVPPPFLEGDPLEIVEALLMAGANESARNNKGETPTEVARSNGEKEIAAYLESLVELKEGLVTVKFKRGVKFKRDDDFVYVYF